MDQKLDLIGKCELRFFSEMSTANAHEIKNALAVINENAGLLNDLALSAEKDSSLDLARIRRIAGTIKDQVARADHIAKSINRFSDCLHKNETVTDIGQSIHLIVDMASRYATLRNVRIDVCNPQGNICLPVRPFSLFQLLWVCLHESIKTCRKGEPLTVKAKKADHSVEIHYGPLKGEAHTFVDNLYQMPEMAALLHSMDGAIGMDPEAATLIVTLHKNNHSR